MKSAELNLLVMHGMGTTPGDWHPDEAGNIVAADGTLVFQNSGVVPFWQAMANAEAVCRYLNHKAEIVMALECHNAYLAHRGEQERLAA